MSAIGPIDQRLLPAAVRTGTADDRARYEAALGFENLLVGQLTKQLAATAQPAEDAEESAATSSYRQMLPTALADAITQAGGLGLAPALYESLPETGSDPASGGGTAA